jgi:NAD-dependent deacetylase
MSTMTEVTQDLIDRIAAARRLVVFTGSGISAESGIPTYRGNIALWAGFRAEELSSVEAFDHDPEQVWKWYEERRQQILAAQPNPAHTGIAAIQQALNGVSLVTQNIDGLHQRAGSKDPIELHGSILRARCTREHIVVNLPAESLKTLPPVCERCGAIMRPDVVWFGEALPHGPFEAAHDASVLCDAMLVVGTSAQVMPAASLPLLAKHNGALVVEVNTERTAISGIVGVTLLGQASLLVRHLAEGVVKAVGSAT